MEELCLSKYLGLWFVGGGGIVARKNVGGSEWLQGRVRPGVTVAFVGTGAEVMVVEVDRWDSLCWEVSRGDFCGGFRWGWGWCRNRLT